MNIKDIKFGDKVVFITNEGFYPNVYAGTALDINKDWAHNHEGDVIVSIEKILYTENKKITLEDYQDLIRLQRYADVNSLGRSIGVGSGYILFKLNRR